MQSMSLLLSNHVMASAFSEAWLLLLIRGRLKKVQGRLFLVPT